MKVKHTETLKQHTATRSAGGDFGGDSEECGCASSFFEVFQRNANGKNDARCLALSGWDESRTLGAPIIATSASILGAEREHIGCVVTLI